MKEIAHDKNGNSCTVLENLLITQAAWKKCNGTRIHAAMAEGTAAVLGTAAVP